jgi:hypothetical protein
LPLSPDEQAMLERLRNLAFGTWFEFRTERDAPPRRLKLAWYSTMTNTYMFVDRAGVKADAKNLLALAEDLRNGHAKILSSEDRPYVTRTLASILAKLRKTVGLADAGPEVAHPS